MTEPLSGAGLAMVSTGLALFGVASMQDWALRLVPNAIPASIALAGLALRGLDGTVVAGLLAAAAVFLAGAVCWRRGWLGGADVKLFAAGALLVPPHDVAAFVLASCLSGGVLALLYAALSCVVPPPSPVRPFSRLRRYLRIEQRRLQRRGPLPYATAITAGVAIIVLRG